MCLKAKEKTAGKKKKKQAQQIEFQDQREPNAGSWAQASCKCTTYACLQNSHPRGVDRIEGSLWAVVTRSCECLLGSGSGNWQHTVESQFPQRVSRCLCLMTPHPSKCKGRLRAPFQGTITQSICRFLEMNIYCFNSCTPTFLDLKKFLVPTDDLQRLERAAFWNSPFKISYRFYNAASQNHIFPFLTSSSSPERLGKQTALLASRAWGFGQMVCVSMAVVRPAFSGYLLIQGESEHARSRTWKFPLYFLWGICLQRKICFLKGCWWY